MTPLLTKVLAGQLVPVDAAVRGWRRHWEPLCVSARVGTVHLAHMAGLEWNVRPLFLSVSPALCTRVSPSARSKWCWSRLSLEVRSQLVT